MNARMAAASIRARLIMTVLARALAWGAAALLGLVLLAAALDALRPLPEPSRAAALWVAVLAAIGVAAAVLWRGRHSLDLLRVALFVEECSPADFVFVTAVSTGGDYGGDVRRGVRPALLRALVVPVAVALVLGGIAVMLPDGVLARVLSPSALDVLRGPAAMDPAASRLAPIVVRVIGPAYAGGSVREEANPSSVRALAGSRIEIIGGGAAHGAVDSIHATVHDRVTVAEADGERWTIRLPLPAAAAAVRLTDRRHERLLALEPVPDLAPVVTLQSPARDTTYATPRGSLTLAASAEDDIGLASLAFEILHTSGFGERFETGRRELGLVQGRGRAAQIRGSIQLDTMRLGPGDVLHIRAIAADRNALTGPGRAASDTRTIRIHDPRQRDTVSLQLGIEIPIDTSVLSQRELIIRAETLLARQRRLRPDTFRARAIELGVRQRQLREHVEEVIEEIETESEDVRIGSTVVSRFLAQAVSAMIDAENELGVASVAGARPHMYRALRLLQQARDATARYYLRGTLPKVVVDLDRARLRGRDSARAEARQPRDAAADHRRALLARLDRAAAIAGVNRAAAADSLTVIRIEALAQVPDAADALARAIAALRVGDPALEPLRAARRRLERRSESSAGILPWLAAP